jgi:V/A-type H+-transporting ATPase subunit I
MFGPLPMRHVTLQVMSEDLTTVSLVLADLAVFHPDHRDLEEVQLRLIPGTSYRGVYRQARTRLSKISAHLGALPPFELGELRVVDEAELAELNERLGALWNECSASEEQAHRTLEEERAIGQLEAALANFANLKVDLAMLQGERRFLDVRIGTVPRDHLNRLQEALGLAYFLVFPYLLTAEQAQIVVVGTKGRGAEVEAVLNTAAFQPLPVPSEFQDHPEHLRDDLAQRRAAVAEARQAYAAEVAERTMTNRTLLEEAQVVLALAEPFVELDSAARSSGYLAVVSGWVPARDLRRLEDTLRDCLQYPFLLTSRRPRPEERREVPSLMRQNRLLAPFRTLVQQYGVPRYGEFDPSAVFAITFVLMFGMMFGDVGHGAVLAIAAVAFRKKLKRFTGFGVAVGLSSMVFGVLYGSVFGYEELFHAVWLAPLSDPARMLRVALYWGIGFLLGATLLRIYNRLMEGDRIGALFDTNGLTTLTLYVGMIWGGFGWFTTGGYGTGAAILTLASLAAIMVYKTAESHASFGERLIIVLVETLEAIMGNVSNTLSFLRVAAFSLNHVALMLAVFALANMMDTVGYWLMVIFGNIFIIVLEGAIVTIQTLRLEYFEGFSRFYSGDGREFRPLLLKRGGSTAPVPLPQPAS